MSQLGPVPKSVIRRCRLGNLYEMRPDFFSGGGATKDRNSTIRRGFFEPVSSQPRIISVRAASGSVDPLKGSEECNEVLLLVAGQLRAKDQVEELDRVVQRQQTTVMHVRRGVLDAAQWERLDRPIPCFPQTVDHGRLEKALDLEIVHQVIGVVRRGVAGTALALAEEDLLPAQLGGGGLAWIELSEHVELRRRRESQKLLELGHDIDLMAALENVDAFLRRDHIVTVEICAPLLEFREILDRFERALRAKQPLDEHASQRGGCDA